TALTSWLWGRDEFQLPDTVITERRAAWRTGWAIDSTKTYGYSISPEDGIAAGVTTELARRALGSSADATTVTADARAYFSPFARHQVLAIRIAGGSSSGDQTVGRTFHLGGGGPNALLLDFGRNAISLMRGFGTDTFAGRYIAVMNADYS